MIVTFQKKTNNHEMLAEVSKQRPTTKSSFKQLLAVGLFAANFLTLSISIKHLLLLK